MESKQKIYFAMQRVMNDMLFHDETIKPIPFIEVALMLADIGQEKVEPELLTATTELCNLMMGKGKFQVMEWEKDQILVVPDSCTKPPHRIKNTKESLFHAFLGYVAKH
jgi:hypothetical protein